MTITVSDLYSELLGYYGSQHWWPAHSEFEVMIGAILTQNTAWSNVEKAIDNLKAQHLLAPHLILDTDVSKLAKLIRPAGYFNVKTKRLRAFCQWYLEQGGLETLNTWETIKLREALLAVKGIGPETADDILLYAFKRPVFVIDAYTRRLLSRLGLISGHEPYEVLRHDMERQLGYDVAVFNEYHALIVMQVKQVCKPRPQCQRCILEHYCPKLGL